MTNLDKMKEVLCSELMKMSAEEFYKFITETELEEYDFFSLEGVLTCSKCREIYGRECCEVDNAHPYCIERFKDYCSKISE